MKRALGFGLILLAVSAVTAQHAMAWGPDGPAFQPDGTLFLLGGPANSSPHTAAQGYLGVDVRDVNADQLSILKLKDAHGAEIVLVDHDAPAGKAGLREHDIVLQMNGQAIDGQDQLRRLLHDSPPGRTITLLISRDGQQITVTAQMANREDVERQAWEQHFTVPEPPTPAVASPDNSYSPAPSPAPPLRGNSFIGTILMSPSYTGAMLEKMTPQLADYFGVSSGAGLLVSSVLPNSPAAAAGMRAGDVVLRADTRPISNPSDWTRALKNGRGKSLTIVILRDKKEQTLTLTPDTHKRSSLDGPANLDEPTVARLGFSWLPAPDF